jgi:hypothetical protein
VPVACRRGGRLARVPWQATLRVGLGARERRRHAARRVPGVPSQGLDLVEPVMYLSWTGYVPMVYSPYTCATETFRMNA